MGVRGVSCCPRACAREREHVRLCASVCVCAHGCACVGKGARTRSTHIGCSIAPGVPSTSSSLRPAPAAAARWSGRRSRASGAQRPRWRWGRGRGREGGEDGEGGRRRIREAPELFDSSGAAAGRGGPPGQLVESGPPGALGTRTRAAPPPVPRPPPECRPRAPLGAGERRPAPGHHAAAAALLDAAARGAAPAGARAEVLGAHGEWARGAGRAASCPGGAGRVPAGPSGRRAQAPRAGDPPARVARAGGAWAARGARAASGAPGAGGPARGAPRAPRRPRTRGRVARGRPGPGARAPPGGLSEGGSAGASAPTGLGASRARPWARGADPAALARRAGEGARLLGPAGWARPRLGRELRSSRCRDTRRLLPLVQAGRHWRAPGTPRPALAGPGPPGQGAPSARVTARTAAGFAFLAATSRRGPATVARCQARSAAQGPSQAAGPARVSQPPARADLVGLQCLQTHN